MCHYLRIIVSLFPLALLCVALFIPLSSYAVANFTASPLIIDYTTEGRDIISRDITLTNNTDRPVRIYASVHEIEVDGVGEVREFVPASMSDRSVSITSWLEISRARLEIPARGTLVVPLTLRIHPTAPPGEYHALIGFATGANRDDIEAKVMSGQAASVLLKITIADQSREQLQVVSFTTDRFTVTDDEYAMVVELENTGDTVVSPAGEVIIYDTSGKEIAAVPVNTGGRSIAPGERVEIYEPLPFIDRLGKNKAYLNLTYGENLAAVSDTAFYYSIPWYYLAVFVSLLLGVLSMLIWVFKRAFVGGDAYLDEHVHDLPMFVKQSHDHATYEHDLNLKHEDKA
jgi:hypothetical protein